MLVFVSFVSSFNLLVSPVIVGYWYYISL